jgi:transposase-like protein
MIEEVREVRSVGQSETEGARRATVVSDLKPDTEVPARRQRHRYTEKYKRDIVAKVTELRQTGSGEIGSYLRSKGLYASTVVKWEKQFNLGNGISVRDKSGKEALEQKVKQLEKELHRTKKKLEKSELIIEFQKKVAELLKLNEE